VVDQVRAGKGPYFIEAVTYRFMGHSMADPAHGHYRTKEEVDEERKRDPLVLLRNTMLEQHLATDGDFKVMEREIGGIVADAVAFAEAGAFPDPKELFTDVYAGD
jgi:pyruvate dehydrogenase E1 component alpha subunit